MRLAPALIGKRYFAQVCGRIASRDDDAVEPQRIVRHLSAYLDLVCIAFANNVRVIRLGRTVRILRHRCDGALHIINLMYHAIGIDAGEIASRIRARRRNLQVARAGYGTDNTAAHDKLVIERNLALLHALLFPFLKLSTVDLAERHSVHDSNARRVGIAARIRRSLGIEHGHVLRVDDVAV